MNGGQFFSFKINRTLRNNLAKGLKNKQIKTRLCQRLWRTQEGEEKMAGKKVRLACIASGGGTDFDSIAKAWSNDQIPEVSEIVLISTKEEAGCIVKADKLGIKHMVVEPANKIILSTFVREALLELGQVDLMFLVGCVFKVDPITNDKGFLIPMYNIHPADIHEHGGDTMYGLAVHEHVLRQIRDQLIRGKKTINDRFYTFPTVHAASRKYDDGPPLLTGSVEVPTDLIVELMNQDTQIKEIAKKLQQIVLPYEWQILPTAVRMAAKKILDGKEG